MWFRLAVKLFQKFNSLPPFWLFLKKHIWNISEESEEISDYHDNDEKNYSYSEEEDGIRGDFISDEDEIINEDEPDICIADIGGASGERADCKFPYIYQGKEYHKCITKDHDTHWCALDMPHFVVNGGLNLFCVKCWQNETYRWGNCLRGKSCGLGQPQSNEDEIINEDDHYEGNFELTYDYHDNNEKIINIQMKKMVLEVLLSQMRMKSSMRMNLTYVLLLLLGKNKTVNFHTPIKERNITNVSQRTMISIGVH